METQLFANERIERSKIRSDGSAFSSKDVPKFFHINDEKDIKSERCGSISGSAEFSAFSGSGSNSICSNSVSTSSSLFRNRSRSISVTDSTAVENTDNCNDNHDSIDSNNQNKSGNTNNNSNNENGHHMARTYPQSSSKGNANNNSNNESNTMENNSNNLNMKSIMKSKSIKLDRNEKNEKFEKLDTNINTAPLTLSLASLQSNSALWNSRSRSAQSHEAVTLSLINPSLNISSLAVRKKFPPRCNVFQIDSEVEIIFILFLFLIFFIISLINYFC